MIAQLYFFEVCLMKLTHSLVAATCLAGSLSAAAVELNTLSVTASTIDDKFSNEMNEASTTSTLSGDAIDEAHTENLQQVLQRIPGITTEVQSGQSIKIHMRGVENQYYMGEKPGVAIVIDGVPVFERTGAVNIDLDNIESVKVIKGGASYLFGDDALAGAVIITTKRGAKYANNYGAVEVGSFGYRKLLARSGYSNENLDAHIQVSQRKADGYYVDSDYDVQYANGKLQYYIDDTSDIAVGFELSHREKDSHGSVRGITTARTDPKSYLDGDYTAMFDVDLFKIFATYSKDLGNDLNLIANLYQYEDTTEFLSGYVEYDLAHNPVTDPHAKTTRTHYEQIQRGFKTELRQSLTNMAWMIGADLRANEYDSMSTNAQSYATPPAWGPVWTEYLAGDLRSKNTTDENVYALYGEYKYAVTPALTATLNMRYDNIQLDYQDFSGLQLNREFDVYSWRVGATYALNDTHAIYANVSTGFRAPTISQLFAGEISTWGSTESNPNLDAEQATNYEIGMRGKAAGLDYDVTVFRIDRKDAIMKTSGNYGDSDADEMYANIGGLRNEGLELAINSDRSQMFSFDLAYSYLRAKYTNYRNFGIELGVPASVQHFDLSENNIPRVSRHNLNLSGTFNRDNKLFLTAEISSRSSYYADELNWNKMGGYTVVNILGNYKTKIAGMDAEIFGRIDNIFDKYYYNTARGSGDSDDDGDFDYEDLSLVVNPGRVFTAGISLKF